MNLKTRLAKLEAGGIRRRVEPLIILRPGPLQTLEGGGKQVHRRDGETRDNFLTRAEGIIQSPVIQQGD